MFIPIITPLNLALLLSPGNETGGDSEYETARSVIVTTPLSKYLQNNEQVIMEAVAIKMSILTFYQNRRLILQTHQK